MGLTIKELTEKVEAQRQVTAAALAEKERGRREAHLREMEGWLDALVGVREALNLEPLTLDGAGSVWGKGRVDLRSGPALVLLWAPLDRGYPRVRIKLADEQTTLFGSRDLGNAESDAAALAALGELALEVEEAVESARKREAEAEARREEKRKQHAAALERGRKGAELLLRVAREHAEIQAAQREAAKAWAEEWTQRLWQPWSGWQVRYVPVGQRVETEEDAVVQTVVVLDDLAEIVAQSPGAAVRVVSPGGHVSERVIGAFLDATPVEHDMPALASAEPFHRSYGGCFSYFVNVPPTVQGEPERAPQCIGWFDYVAGRLGVLHAERLAYEMRLEPAALAKMDVEQLADWWQVQELAEVEI